MSNELKAGDRLDDKYPNAPRRGITTFIWCTFFCLICGHFGLSLIYFRAICFWQKSWIYKQNIFGMILQITRSDSETFLELRCEEYLSTVFFKYPETCSTTTLLFSLVSECEPLHLLQCFAYPTWLPIAPAIQVSLTIMACDDISPAKFCFCYLKALPVVFLTWSCLDFL